MNNQYNTKNLSHIRNFIDVFKSMAINSIGEVFSIGEFAYDETGQETKIFIITSFSLDEYRNEVIAESDLGSFRIDNIKNLYSDTGIVEESETCGIDSTYGVEEIKKERLNLIDKNGIDTALNWKLNGVSLLQDASLIISSVMLDSIVSYKSFIKRLSKAGALIASEIDGLKSLLDKKENIETHEILTNEDNDIDNILPKL